MKAGGLSSAPLDTIKFIRETLYFLGIIDDQELSEIKTGKGFSGKKQAMLRVLQDKQELINSKSDEIAQKVEATLDDFIGGVGVNRSREEKYAAQAAAQEIANQMRQAKSGKEMDDALADVVDSEMLLVKASIAKILGEINRNLGEPGFDIEDVAIDEVTEYSKNIDSLAKLKSFISQIQSEPGYEKIAAYLSSAVKPIANGTEDEEMEDPEEFEMGADGFDTGQSDDNIPPQYEEDGEDEEDDTEKDVEEDEENPKCRTCRGTGWVKEEYNGEMENETCPDCKGKVSTPNEDEEEDDDQEEKEVVKESYTANYMTEQVSKDKYFKPSKEINESFKDRMQPKSIGQLIEARKYGM